MNPMWIFPIVIVKIILAFVGIALYNRKKRLGICPKCGEPFAVIENIGNNGKLKEIRVFSHSCPC